MNVRRIHCVALLILGSIACVAQSTESPAANRTAQATSAPVAPSGNTAIIPVPKLEDDSYDWYQRHEDVLALKGRIDPQIVLIGDSITHFWGGEPRAAQVRGPLAWDEAFHDLPVVNLGFGWDRTQNVLWRLDHGEFDGFHPRVVVINIGTNNLSGTEHARSSTPAEIVAAILKIRAEIVAKSPASRVIVMGIFPRGFDTASRFRAPILEVNRLLAAALDGMVNTQFLDIGTQFLQPDGRLPKTMMSDGTHPTEAGYKVWAESLLQAGVRD